MLENKEIETIVNQVLRTIGNEDSENSKPVMIFGDVNITIHCDDCGDDDVPPAPQISYNYNYPAYSDAESEAERNARQRFYRANTYTG